MWTNILLSLIGILTLVIYDWAHLKSTYKFTDFWLNYLVAFITGAFLFSYLIRWKYFQYAQIVSCVVLMGIFGGAIIGWVKSIFSRK
jgi:hypothetical protein